jgi:hypothetical protein
MIFADFLYAMEVVLSCHYNEGEQQFHSHYISKKSFTNRLEFGALYDILGSIVNIYRIEIFCKRHRFCVHRRALRNCYAACKEESQNQPPKRQG